MAGLAEAEAEAEARSGSRRSMLDTLAGNTLSLVSVGVQFAEPSLIKEFKHNEFCSLKVPKSIMMRM